MPSPLEEYGLNEARDEENNIIISDLTLRYILPTQLNSMTYRYKVMCGCDWYISSKSMHYYLLTWHNCRLKHLKDRSHNAQNRRYGEYQVVLLKPIRIKYNLMVVIFKILLQTCIWKQYVPVPLNIMGYCTGNVCYVVVISYQVLSYPVRRHTNIQHTCVQQ